MALTVKADSAWPTKLTIVSDRRKHPAIAAEVESVVITVTSSTDTATYNATREIRPAVSASVDPIEIIDPRPGKWTVVSDDGVTAVYTFTAA